MEDRGSERKEGVVRRGRAKWKTGGEVTRRRG